MPNRISERVDELAARFGISRSRVVLVCGPTRREAERNAAEYLGNGLADERRDNPADQREPRQRVHCLDDQGMNAG